MRQETTFGDAELSTYMRVDRASGITQFYKVVDSEAIEIDEAEYNEGAG